MIPAYVATDSLHLTGGPSTVQSRVWADKGIGHTELRPWRDGVAELRVHALGGQLLEGVEGSRLRDAVLLDDHIGRAARRDDRAAQPLVGDVALDQHDGRDKRRCRREDQPFSNRRRRT